MTHLRLRELKTLAQGHTAESIKAEFNLMPTWPQKKKMDFPGGSDGKVSVYNAGNPGSSPGLGRFPGERNGNPLQYYCLENPIDSGAW